MLKTLVAKIGVAGSRPPFQIFFLEFYNRMNYNTLHHPAPPAFKPLQMPDPTAIQPPKSLIPLPKAAIPFNPSQEQRWIAGHIASMGPISFDSLYNWTHDQISINYEESTLSSHLNALLRAGWVELYRIEGAFVAGSEWPADYGYAEMPYKPLV